MTSSTRSDFLAANRANWDERVAIHRRDDTGAYRVDRFLAGDDTLNPIEESELGDVAGRRLVHLQCHFGLDTLRLARRGAQVVGVDFSLPAIEEARRLAAAAGLPQARFVHGDVYDAPALVGSGFDIVYTTWGTICWLPDVARWAATIAALLAPGGFLYFADGHPGALVLEEREGRLVPWYAPDTAPDQPLVFDADITYTGDPTPLAAKRTYEWIHSLSRIVNSLLGAGLRLEFLNEHPSLPWKVFPMCIRDGDRLYRLPDDLPRIPLAVSLRARK
jgi:SAM-dependent methyltransferase